MKTELLFTDALENYLIVREERSNARTETTYFAACKRMVDAMRILNGFFAIGPKEEYLDRVERWHREQKNREGSDG